jgi:hypothetical protein
MSAVTIGRVWHPGRARQVPSTFRTKDRRFRARIYLRAFNVTTEQLCEHEHATEAEAEACAAEMVVRANKGR